MRSGWASTHTHAQRTSAAMALAVVPASGTLASVSAPTFAAGCGGAHCRLWNGGEISAFGAELAICGRARSRSAGSRSRSSSRSELWGSPKLLQSGNGDPAKPWKATQGRVSVRAMAEKEVVETVETVETVESKALASSDSLDAVHAQGLPVQVLEAKGLAYDGPGKGGQWLSSTTRHVRIYIGVADPETKLMDQTQLDKITLMLDPDNEFIWPEDKVQKVYDYFAELVEAYAGAPCTEYTMRLIGSDIEHYIRKLLLGNEIHYNLDCRVLNFSMGKPRYESGIIEEAEE